MPSLLWWQPAGLPMCDATARLCTNSATTQGSNSHAMRISNITRTVIDHGRKPCLWLAPQTDFFAFDYEKKPAASPFSRRGRRTCSRLSTTSRDSIRPIVQAGCPLFLSYVEFGVIGPCVMDVGSDVRVGTRFHALTSRCCDQRHWHRAVPFAV